MLMAELAGDFKTVDSDPLLQHKTHSPPCDPDVVLRQQNAMATLAAISGNAMPGLNMPNFVAMNVGLPNIGEETQ